MTKHAQSQILAALAASGALFAAGSAHASSPLEYPDNGAASFSRGGAWLATANEPIAAHYNPAALATQPSGFSIDQNLSFNHVCYDRKGPNGLVEGPAPGLEYRPVCNSRGGFPSTIPSIALAWRVSRTVGVGLAIVPPATYVVADQQFPALTVGYNTAAQQYQQVPSPWRYQILDQPTTIVFPTLGIGWEAFKNFRVGAAFIAGIATINTTLAGIATETKPPPGVRATDEARYDGFTNLKTNDLFVPGAILSLHWSPFPSLDVAAWGRWIDSVSTTKGEVTLTKNAYAQNPPDGSPSFSQVNPLCRQGAAKCADDAGVATPFHYGNDVFRKFKFPFSPEIRIGIRYHHPRRGVLKVPVKPGLTQIKPVRDPLHDDLFDVEVDGTYAMNSSANTIEVRFADNGAGQGIAAAPPGYVPPNADRWNGYKDSYGLRVGGQWNVLPDKLGIRAGTWFETRAQEPEWLQVGIVAAMRGGYGGGIVFRQDFIDISIGYQRHWSAGQDNHGNGRMLTTVTTSAPEPNLNLEPPGVSAANRTQYRNFHAINDGHVTQSAHVFTLGGTIRF